ncbi:hypothetical protein FISHEDRAFT_78185 [Fistulina hepatica ATCC 64428]|nr:hypothetical protein FISHEDRAFT_78185 [Fistulina hepatica ATCC 64428]
MVELDENDGVKQSNYRDFFDGQEYLDAYADGRILDDDIMLMLSMDGAQIYQNKASNCWMYIWVILDLPIEQRYKKHNVLPGGIIPGPHKPKKLDSFLFPGLFHLSALQHNGLTIWNASKRTTVKCHPFLALISTDSPAMASLSGQVGPNGCRLCCFYCEIVGRHVDLQQLLRCSSDSAYVTVNYEENLKWLCHIQTKAQYEHVRRETGIVKPTIFSGLSAKHCLSIPGLFCGDCMHLPALNLTDLLIPLFRGTFDCDSTDDKSLWSFAILQDANIWKAHGKQVADFCPYIPGSFDRPPRNPAEKISSGYKAWEFLLYFFGLGPCLFYELLPDNFYVNYCQGIAGTLLMLQHEISPNDNKESNRLLTKFSDDFELLYAGRHIDRIHFVHPSIHGISHWPFETFCISPPMIYSQWTMERFIGNLTEEISQHSNAFSNLFQ